MRGLELKEGEYIVWQGMPDMRYFRNPFIKYLIGGFVLVSSVALSILFAWWRQDPPMTGFAVVTMLVFFEIGHLFTIGCKVLSNLRDDFSKTCYTLTNLRCLEQEAKGSRLKEYSLERLCRARCQLHSPDVASFTYWRMAEQGAVARYHFEGMCCVPAQLQSFFDEVAQSPRACIEGTDICMPPLEEGEILLWSGKPGWRAIPSWGRRIGQVAASLMLFLSLYVPFYLLRHSPWLPCLIAFSFLFFLALMFWIMSKNAIQRLAAAHYLITNRRFIEIDTRYESQKSFSLACFKNASCKIHGGGLASFLFELSSKSHSPHQVVSFVMTRPYSQKGLFYTRRVEGLHYVPVHLWETLAISAYEKTEAP